MAFTFKRHKINKEKNFVLNNNKNSSESDSNILLFNDELDVEITKTTDRKSVFVHFVYTEKLFEDNDLMSVVLKKNTNKKEILEKYGDFEFIFKNKVFKLKKLFEDSTKIENQRFVHKRIFLENTFD